MRTMSSRFRILAFFCIFINCAASALVSGPGSGGTPGSKSVHRRMLTTHHKKDYIQAVRCLQSLPARNTTNPRLQTRFDEMLSLHIDSADSVHIVGQFLPWHRQYIIIHEKMLREECRYRGPIPYWDWARDADKPGSMRNSPVFDSDTGFGGDGVPDTYTLPANYNSVISRVPINPYAFKGCVGDGAFSSYTLPIGPGKLVAKHCLVRGINETYKEYLTSERVQSLIRQRDFESFRVDLEGRPVTRTPKVHDAAHVLVGGDMSNFYSSAADPLFFLHHANLDRIWWIWQQIDPAKRLYEITGRSTVNPPYRNVTLDDLLDFGTFSPSIPIRQVMNIHADSVCYTYV